MNSVAIATVSSRLDYSNLHPERRIPLEEIDHELQHLKKREQLSMAVATVGMVLSMVALVGVLGAGNIIFGALVAVTLLAGLYAYLCRQAESSLRSRQVAWVTQNTPELRT